MNEERYGAGTNGHTQNPFDGAERQPDPFENLLTGSQVPSTLFEVDSDGCYRISDELEAVRLSDPIAATVPLKQIENLAIAPDAEERVERLAESIADRPRSGLIASMDKADEYLVMKGTQTVEEQSRVKAERDALPYDVMNHNPALGVKSMTVVEIAGYVVAGVFFLGMAIWTAGADLTLLYSNLSVAYPIESGEIDYAAMHGSDAASSDTEPPEETPIYKDPNAWKSVSGIAVLFVFCAILDPLKHLPLSSHRSFPKGLRPKLRWLFTPTGLRVVVLLVLIVASVAFNLMIGFELDQDITNPDAKPPIPSVVSISLMAFALAFAVYAFLHWLDEIYQRLKGVEWCENPKRILLDIRSNLLADQVESIANVLGCFAGLRADHNEARKEFVGHCIAELSGIQTKQREQQEHVNAVAEEAAAAARVRAFHASNN
ncbi:hypothetical protein RBSH_01618 [Rhodopirellula baltica SH28]|uniref:Uncharacterized protein n=1 Tax=Rhodopirellula baltica SH28 TaxID=993517 RepID=K5CG11_RHOBT|nr:hypothetical protein [Rhodopirellula baltica]EKK02925.1 hypothetical protein RBSH_01618 [Rhodopirellula baltica SH28]